jgi:hypothetical protein
MPADVQVRQSLDTGLPGIMSEAIDAFIAPMCLSSQMHPGSTDQDICGMQTLAPASTTPSITFESLTFSDGTTIELDHDDIVLFVGPNNAGKSLALRELEEHIGVPVPGIVIKSANCVAQGQSTTSVRSYEPTLKSSSMRATFSIPERGSTSLMATFNTFGRSTPASCGPYSPCGSQQRHVSRTAIRRRRYPFWTSCLLTRSMSFTLMIA